jgi:diguanylate cyclase
VLRLVASSINQNVKGRDTAARYGGEEFAVILPNTVLRSAMVVAYHIELMKRSTGEHLGRASPLHKTDSPQSFIERTDCCLHVAKRHGRNRVMTETNPEVTASGVATAQAA